MLCRKHVPGPFTWRVKAWGGQTLCACASVLTAKCCAKNPEKSPEVRAAVGTKSLKGRLNV